MTNKPPDTQNQPENNKYEKNNSAYEELLRRSVYGYNQHQICPVNILVRNKPTLMTTFNMQRSALQLLLLEKFIFSRKQKQDQFGQTVIDLSDAVFIKRETLALEFLVSYKDIENAESRLIKRGLIISTGVKGKKQRRQIALTPLAIRHFCATNIIPLKDIYKTNKLSREEQDQRENSLERNTKLSREECKNNTKNENLFKNGISIIGMLNRCLTLLQRLTEWKAEELNNVMAIVQPKIESDYDYAKFTDVQLTDLLTQILKEAGIELPHTKNPQLPAKKVKKQSDKQFLFNCSKIYYGKFPFDGNEELEDLRSTLVKLSKLHGQQYVLNYLEDCAKNDKCNGHKLSQILGETFNRYLRSKNGSERK